MNNFSTEGLKRIGSHIPKSLEAALNYSGQSRWVALYPDQEIAKETRLSVVLFDGRDTYAGERQPWELFLQSEGAWKLKRHLEQLSEGAAGSWLLIDRHDRNLYIGERTAVEGFLSQPKTQELLLDLDRDRPKRFDRYCTIAKLTGIGLAAAAILGGMGYGAYLGISNLQENPIVVQRPELPSNSLQETSPEKTPQENIAETMDSLMWTGIRFMMVLFCMFLITVLITEMRQNDKK